jgi:hypothetical protein
LSSGRSTGSSMLNHLKAESRELLWAQAAKEACRINVEVWVPIVQILLRPALKNLVCPENQKELLPPR